MKGTLQEITGQKTGFIGIADEQGDYEFFLDDWSIDDGEWDIDVEHAIDSVSVLSYLIEKEAITFEGDTVIRNYKIIGGMKDVTLQELNTFCVLYSTKDKNVVILVPYRWD